MAIALDRLAVLRQKRKVMTVDQSSIWKDKRAAAKNIKITPWQVTNLYRYRGWLLADSNKRAALQALPGRLSEVFSDKKRLSRF